MRNSLIVLMMTALTLFLFYTNAYAMTYFLQQDLGIRGNMRYCKYSNGKIYSVNATELCELQIKEGGVPTQRGTMGFYLGEYQDGMTKVCIYNVLGNKRAIRINSFEVCQPSVEF